MRKIYYFVLSVLSIGLFSQALAAHVCYRHIYNRTGAEWKVGNWNTMNSGGVDFTSNGPCYYKNGTNENCTLIANQKGDDGKWKDVDNSWTEIVYNSSNKGNWLAPEKSDGYLTFFDPDGQRVDLHFTNGNSRTCPNLYYQDGYTYTSDKYVVVLNGPAGDLEFQAKSK